MIQVEKVTSPEERFILSKEYIKTLASPIDSYWESVIIGKSQCYIIIYNGKKAGHFFVDSKRTLVQFYIFREYFIHAPEIFEYLISNDIAENAAVSTKETEFLSLCLDYQKSISIDSYLFTDNKDIKYELANFKDVSFRLAKSNDIGTIKTKCDPAFEGYYEDLIENNQLFVLYSGDILLGIGEFRISKSNEQYGDIGMIVTEQYRRKGVGTYIITQLKEHCYRNNLKPVASCNHTNIASKKTLEKSGFISNHRIIYVTLK
jgi:GNAT superfamily N-acetyltransferase